jgi:hypothetical protein
MNKYLAATGKNQLEAHHRLTFANNRNGMKTAKEADLEHSNSHPHAGDGR